MRRLGTTLAALALLASGGCGGDTTGPTGTTQLQASFTGLPESGTYSGDLELWISFAVGRVGGASLRHTQAASAGKFHVVGGKTVGLDGQPMTFALDPSDPNVRTDSNGNILWQLAVDAFVTIEPADDPEPAVHGPAFMGGSFRNGTTQLSIGSSDALDEDFATIDGTFLMACPSTSAGGDETEGIWFVTSTTTPAASLNLPTLSVNDPQKNWTYQAWISLPSAGLASLGKFKSPILPDGDLDGPLHGVPPTDSSGYPFPGSDFPYGSAGIDLSLGSVIITLEPVPDNDSGAPFFLEVLGAPIPTGATAGVSYPLSPQPQTFPGGTVTIPVGS